jgi:DNA-binding NarL/FixJ family response regulator
MSDPVPGAGLAAAVVGREPERGRIDAFVSELPRGARALLIGGDPGIGKTTLWRLGLVQCRAAGFQVLVARPAEEEMPLALVGLADLFEPLGLDDELLRSDDPFVRGRFVLEGLRSLSEQAPIVLAIDDLQWLDSISARALRFALRRLDSQPVGVLATVRTGAEANESLDLAANLPSDRLRVCTIGPVDEEVLRGILAKVVEAIPRPTLHRIHRISGGNPLYAIELARAVRDDPGARSALDLRLPQSLAVAIGDRLDAAPAQLGPLLEVVSVLGRTRAPELLEFLPNADVDALLARAQRLGLLVVGPDLEVRFAHPLFASAVYARTSPIARRSLHARVAGLATDPDARARHLALSVDGPDSDTARLLEEASERARTRGASDLAADFARQSLGLTPNEDADARRRRSLALVTHLAAAGEVSAALGLADELVASLPHGRDRAVALVERARLEGDELERNEGLLLQALEEAGDDDLLRGQVLDQLGWVRGMFLGDMPTGIAWAHEALELADRVGDRELQMSASAGIANLQLFAGRPQWDLIERAVALEEEIGTPRLWGGPRNQLAAYRRFAGDLAGAKTLLEATYSEAMRSGNERWRPYGLYNLAGLEFYGGNFKRADDLIRQAMDAAVDAEDSHVERWISYQRAQIAAWLGRSDEARAIIARILEWADRRGERPATARARSLLGLLAISEGDVETAVTECLKSARSLLEMGIVHPGAVPALPNATEALALSGDLEAADGLLAELDAWVPDMDSRWASALAERARGLVLLGRGDAEQAGVILEASAATLEGLGFVPDAARSMLARGRALLRAGRRSQAAEALGDARHRFAQMGASLWEAQAANDLERAAPGRASGRLTATEARVAELVTRGSKNREIAGELFMSVATVEAHLTRIYRKLGIRSRSDLSRLVAEGSLDADLHGIRDA